MSLPIVVVCKKCRDYGYIRTVHSCTALCDDSACETSTDIESCDCKLPKPNGKPTIDRTMHEWLNYLSVRQGQVAPPMPVAPPRPVVPAVTTNDVPAYDIGDWRCYTYRQAYRHGDSF